MRTGALLVGAHGYVAAATIAGVLAARRGVPLGGMVSALDEFAHLPLADPRGFVFGGWDIRPGSPRESARTLLARNLPVDPALVDLPAGEWDDVAEEVRPGCAINCGPAVSSDPGFCISDTLPKMIERLREDIRSFRRRKGIDRVVVVNLASTEPPLPCPGLSTAAEVEESVAGDRRDAFRAGGLYAYAAIREGCPFVNFTPSDSCLPRGMVELARERGVPVMGNDGKTGETLLKSVLAPLFRCRNLEVLGWEGVNLLGNSDGRVLDDPAHASAKLRSKGEILPSLLGYAPGGRVRIDHFPSLDDRKIAWDFIHFRGFLGAQMSLQFVWQGHDSLLAAPLVLDLVRFADLALRRGEEGVMPHLASFFKAPLGTQEHRFYEQFDLLRRYAAVSSATTFAQTASAAR